VSLGWIKITGGLCDKPEVMRLARTLEISRDEAVGLLVRFWTWTDSVTVDGVVDAVVDADVDGMMAQPGFARSLEAVGWLQIDGSKAQLRIPNFERHNGESAKKRALKSERQARWRNKTVDASVDAHVDVGASTREEKRRSKNKPTPPPTGGSTIWDFGRSLLGEQGLSQSAASGVIGMWLRDWPEAEVASALRSAAGKADIKAYVSAILKAKPKKVDPQTPRLAI
jgi:hypothetical protein